MLTEKEIKAVGFKKNGKIDILGTICVFLCVGTTLSVIFFLFIKFVMFRMGL